MAFIRLTVATEDGTPKYDVLLDPVSGIWFGPGPRETVTRIQMPNGFTTYVKGSLDEIARRISAATRTSPLL
jgi:hypothetical protein